MKIACKSDIGRVRDKDEDSIIVLRIGSIHESRESWKLILILGDGMGGPPAGEVASYLGTRILAKFLMTELLSAIKEINYSSALESGIKKANKEIFDYAMRNPQYRGMGTTLVAAILDNEKLYVGNVGDSRLYIINEEEIKQITEDHTAGAVLTRVVGCFPDVEVDLTELTLKKEDIILMCCDGLTDMVEDNEIQRIVLESKTVEDACNNLVHLANEMGGMDNISLILVKNED
ncbi:MAG: serine/threonine-protein phosphatase [Candidatus Altiarchaeales archaeon]|nr:MAG: serine/threonine-protein phosphatase [Candidatus Altiarchaeales archaeon]